MTDISNVIYHFDNAAAKEWERFDRSIASRVEYLIHHRFLMRHVRAGDSVLDLGCGPGRFAIEMLKAGARVTLGDISPAQLDLAKEKLAEASVTGDAFHEVDVRDLAKYTDGQFDMVVCIGGALSYVKEDYEDALQEMARVVRPEGRVLVGAMSL